MQTDYKRDLPLDTLITVFDKDYRCLNREKKWIGKDGKIRFHTHIEKIVEKLKNPGRLMLANSEDTCQVFEYSINPPRQWEKINTYVLVVASHAEKTFKCVPLGDLKIHFLKKSQPSDSVDSKKINQRNSNLGRVRSNSTQSNRSRSNSNQLAPRQAVSQPTSREPSPYSSRSSSRSSSRGSSPSPSREPSPPPFSYTRSGEPVFIPNPLLTLLNPKRAKKIQLAPYTTGRTCHKSDNVLNILKSSNLKNAHAFLLNRHNLFEVFKYRVKEMTDGKKYWWLKKIYHLMRHLNTPQIVSFVPLTQYLDQPKPERKLLDISPPTSLSSLDLSSLVKTSPSSAHYRPDLSQKEAPQFIINPSKTQIDAFLHVSTTTPTTSNKPSVPREEIINSLEYLASLIPFNKMINLDLYSIDPKKLPNFLKSHSSIKSMPLLQAVNGKSVESKDIRDIVGQIDYQIKYSYCLFLPESNDPMGIHFYWVKEKIINDWGKFSLYVDKNESPDAQIYIRAKGMSPEQELREGRPELLDQWLESFYNFHKCIPFYQLFGGGAHHRFTTSAAINEYHRNTTIIWPLEINSKYPIFDHIFTYNAKKNWKIPVIFPKELHQLDERSSYFYFKPNQDNKAFITLVFCKNNEEPKELDFSIVAVEESFATICIEYEHRKLLIDLKILSALLKKEGFKPIYTLDKFSKKPSSQEASTSEKSYNPFLEPFTDIDLEKGSFNPFIKI